MGYMRKKLFIGLNLALCLPDNISMIYIKTSALSTVNLKVGLNFASNSSSELRKKRSLGRNQPYTIDIQYINNFLCTGRRIPRSKGTL